MNREQLKDAIYEALLEQARGMDSDSLCEYFADHELEDYTEGTDEELAATLKQLKGE